MIVLAAIVGSGVGALARYGVSGAVQRRTRSALPLGTAAVNVAGALLLGALTGLQAAGRLDVDAVTIMGTGFCGGFTTFSTWMVESVRLGEEGGTSGLVAIAANVGLVFLAGLAGVALTSG